MISKKLDIVICLHKDNIKNLYLATEQLYKHLTNINIKIIASKDLKSEIEKVNSKLEFIDEDKLIKNLTLKNIKEQVKELIGIDKRAGWYFQQFLKMGYSLSESSSEYYLIWDSDLILLKDMNFFEENKMVIYKKEEYHKPYFETLEKVLGLKKEFNFSFIAEHMIIKKEIMREIIYKIEENPNLKGKYYFEKILNSIKKSDLNGSGFSEFETYGTYALKNYPELFILEKINAWRDAGIVFNNIRINNYILEELEKSKYDNFSLEKWSKPYKFTFLLKSKFLGKTFGFFNIVSLIEKIN